MAFSNKIVLAVIAASAVVMGAEGFAPVSRSQVVSFDGQGSCQVRASVGGISLFGSL
jgi:hypothetical protein